MLQSLLGKHENKHIFLKCRTKFRSMLIQGANEQISRSKLCKLRGPAHWHPKTSDTILEDNEMAVTCPFCMVDIETYKLKQYLWHNAC